MDGDGKKEQFDAKKAAEYLKSDEWLKKFQAGAKRMAETGAWKIILHPNDRKNLEKK